MERPRWRKLWLSKRSVGSTSMIPSQVVKEEISVNSSMSKIIDYVIFSTRKRDAGEGQSVLLYMILKEKMFVHMG